MYLARSYDEDAARGDFKLAEIDVMHSPTILEPYDFVESVKMHLAGFHKRHFIEEFRHMADFQTDAGGVVADHVVAAEDFFQVIHRVVD